MPRPRHAADKTWPWLWAGACAGLLLGSLLFAPARWLAHALHEQSQGHVALLDARGTVWQGSAELVLTGGAGSRDTMRLPQRMQWQLLAAWDGLRLELALRCCAEQPLALTLRPGTSGLSLELAANRSHWPARLLSGLGAPWNTLALDGQLRLSHDRLQLRLTRDGVVLADGNTLTLDAEDLASSLSTLRPMGSYRIELRGGAVPEVTLSTIDGALLLSGQGRFKGKRFRFDGEARAAAAHEAELANLLNIIGRRDGQRSVITLVL